ncbi:hypothetical protein QLH51_10930 [Sphingomonas sp. 2R-10]|uniref:hypothetical protein n=1 Tax=Sphingomonas sp. 2R-10 TaxID=3045148 RepID=UPI0019CFBA93|nr:hypothetical protein [Sphingomonas sp. 2R-10]MDJ0277308.1 hypothetical protein [Sphingomonas sp. 2R-10]
MGPGDAGPASRTGRTALTRRFTRFAAIDWSGQAVARPKGLAVAELVDGAPTLVEREGGWSRGAILERLAALADEGADMLIGLDLSPALPFVDRGSYFPGWDASPGDARTLWAMVDAMATDDPHLAATSVVAHDELSRHFRRHRACGDLFGAGRGRLRVCEERQLAAGLSPTSCFNLVGAAQVGKSSLTGMRVLHRLGGRLPIWPFDPVPERGPVLVEIYTTIAARAAGVRRGLSKLRDAASLDAALAVLGSPPHVAIKRYDDHATDALVSAAWLRGAAADAGLWQPEGLTSEVARTEGWTFGVQ